MSKFLDIALKNVARGFRVFPLAPNDKNPWCPGGVYDATTDPAKIREWASTKSNANVGCAGGKEFIGVDTDRKSRLFEICIERGIPLSVFDTYTVESGKPDRAHFYYTPTPEAVAFGNKKASEKPIPGNIFETKPEGAYLVGEGSTHPDNPEWVYTAKKDISRTAFPSVLLGLLKELDTELNKRTADGKGEWPQIIHDGEGREDFLVEYAGTLRRKGENEDTIFEMLQIVNANRIAPPKPEKDLRRIAHSIGNKPLPAPEPTLAPIAGPKGPRDFPVIDTEFDAPKEWNPRLDVKPEDYIDLLAEELIKGTPLPFAYGRETLKLLLLAGLHNPPGLPWIKNLHTRQYVILLSDEPGIGKGETWRRATATLDKSDFIREFAYHIIDGDSLGSPEYSVVQFGGRLQKRDKDTEPTLTVQITKPRNIVHYDEGKKLAQKDHAAGSSGLVTMFTKLFDSNSHSTGSFKNGTSTVTDANVSLMLHFVRESFELTFAGTGVTADGFLSRCTFVMDHKNPLQGDWHIVDSVRVAGLMEKIRECMHRHALTIHTDSVDIRLAFLNELRQWEPKFRSRLEFLFNQDLLTRAMFSKDGLLDREVVERAAAWTRHQYETRMLVYPLDVSPDKREQMGTMLRTALLKHGPLTRSQLLDFGHVYRATSGGITVFAQVFAAMKLVQVAANKKGRPVYDLPDRAPLPPHH